MLGLAKKIKTRLLSDIRFLSSSVSTTTMSEFSLEDCDSWSRVSSVTSEGPVVTHVMVVENFDSLVQEMENGKFVDSAEFNIGNTKWKLRIYPAGVDEVNKDISLFLVNCNDQDYHVRYSIEACGKTLNALDEFPGQSEWGWPCFITKEDYWEKVKKEFHIKTEVAIVKKDENKVISGKGMMKTKASNEPKILKKIFGSEDYSDFKLLSNGNEFKCHKIILAARSETIKNAIDRWAPEGEMNLNEYKPEVVDNLLRYCYLQPLEKNVFEENVIEFLNIGEKYNLSELKEKAELFMISSMEKETVVDFLVAGDLFVADQVKEAALRFLCLNKPLLQENLDELKGKENLLMEIIARLSA